MKNKICYLVNLFIIIQICFCTKSMAVETNSNQYTNEQIAIREIADAYYNKGIKAQYCTDRRTYFYAPEEATAQNTLYSMCSAFTFSAYYQTFGITLPVYTHQLITYANKYYDANNIKTNDVIEYWQKNTDEQGNKVYKDNNGNEKSLDMSTDEGRKKYASKLLKEFNLQVGDIIVYHTGIKNSNEGHALLVYEIIYDENGEPIDAKIRESTSKSIYKTKTTKITKGLSYSDELNENNNIREETFKELYLVNNYKTSSSTTRDSVMYMARNMSYFAVLRPLLKDENGNYTGKYYYSTFKSQANTEPAGYVCNGRNLKAYQMTQCSQLRMNYKGIEIEKTVNAFNNSMVNLGDMLEYTIEVKNNSSNTYKSFDVVENIPESVEISNGANGIVEENKIMWKIDGLEPQKTKEVKYTVKIKNDIQNLGSEIISTGTVAVIPSSTVKNKVTYNLKNNEKEILKNGAEKLINDGKNKGLGLISNIYKETLGIDLNMNKFDITDLIKIRNGIQYYPQNVSNVPTIYLNTQNEFSYMIVNNYYGALYSEDSGKVHLKRWENTESDFSYFKSRAGRMDTIYKENFQTGDILVYKNNQTADDKVDYQTENGLYYLIYIGEEDKININNSEISGFVGIDENGKIQNIKNDFSSLQILLGKDYYVVFRPSMVTTKEIQSEIPSESPSKASQERKSEVSKEKKSDVSSTTSKNILPNTGKRYFWYCRNIYSNISNFGYKIEKI